MRALTTLAALLIAQPLAAQPGGRPDPATPDGENMATPVTWQVRFDDGHGDEHGHDHMTVGADTTADVYFVNMRPGWHVTTGPAVVLYHPASTATGEWRAETKIHLFEPGERNEAFGLVFGGTDLGGDGVAYDYFLVRKTGEFIVKRRTGSETSVLIPWTRHDAVVPFGPDSEGAVANTLTVAVGAGAVVFSVNGQEVAQMPRADLRTEGLVGLRINHGLNVHVEDFSVESD